MGCFIELEEGEYINVFQLGRIVPDYKELTIDYECRGGQIYTVQCETEAQVKARVEGLVRWLDGQIKLNKDDPYYGYITDKFKVAANSGFSLTEVLEGENKVLVLDNAGLLRVVQGDPAGYLKDKISFQEGSGLSSEYDSTTKSLLIKTNNLVKVNSGDTAGYLQDKISFKPGSGLRAVYNEENKSLEIDLSGGGGGGSTVKVVEEGEAGYLLNKISFTEESGLSSSYNEETDTLELDLAFEDVTVQACESYPAANITSTSVVPIGQTGGGNTAVGTVLTLNNKMKITLDTKYRVILSQGNFNEGARIGIYSYDFDTDAFELVATSAILNSNTTGVVDFTSDKETELTPDKTYYFVLFASSNNIRNIRMYGTDSSVLTLGNYRPCPSVRIAGNVNDLNNLPTGLENNQNGDSLFYCKVFNTININRNRRSR